jgi:hypothetical protein
VTTIDAADVAAMLASDHPVDRTRLRIVGTLDLRRLGTVGASLRCRACVFDGAVLARDVTFASVVDLSGSTVTGRTDFRGATFQRTFSWRDGRLGASAAFGLAMFTDGAMFDRSSFAGPADFSGGHFAGAAAFSDTDFLVSASFAGVSFGHGAEFRGSASESVPRSEAAAKCRTVTMGAFAHVATFAGATVSGLADFRGRCFSSDAVLTDMSIQGAVTFDGAEFVGKALLRHSVVTGNASIRNALLRTDIDLRDASIRGDLIFDGDVFEGATDLTHATVGGMVSFAYVYPGTVLYVDRLDAGGLFLELTALDWAPSVGAQIDLLQAVERTARTKGQTDLANDARFEWLRRSGESNRDVVDFVFYREIAGYLVKPIYPLRVLLAFLIIATLVRAGALLRRPAEAPSSPGVPQSAEGTPSGPAFVPTQRRERAADPPAAPSGGLDPAPSGDPDAVEPELASLPVVVAGPPAATRQLVVVADPRKPNQRVGRGLSRVAAAIVRSAPATIAVLVPRLPAIDIDTKERARSYGTAIAKLTEWAIVKALLVLALLCIANANETLHQFILALLNR